MRTDRAWHALDAATVLAETAGSAAGLGEQDAARRLATQGPNALPAPRRTGWTRVLLRQFQSALVLILLAAAALAWWHGDAVDTGAILAIVLLNAAVGFQQEWKAETALAALHRMVVPRARVLREGRVRQLPADRLVTGDLVLVEAGDHVPADLRLLAADGLAVDEAALTGESVPVAKTTQPVPEGTAPALRTGMAYLGTSVVRGRATGVVVATGADTAFGEIARLTGTVREGPTPLQRRLVGLGRQLGLIGVGAACIVATCGWLLGRPPFEMLMTGVSLAVAVVPEGLPAVVTLTLAIGVRALARRRALLRRLAAAETLGAATVVCTDKTGTLTQGEMTVQRIWTPRGSFDVTGVGWQPTGHVAQDGRPVSAAEHPHLHALLSTAQRCNRATLEQEGGVWRALGDPTEAALLVVAAKAGLVRHDAARTAELPFDGDRKRMTVVEPRDDGLLAQVKGAPEVIVSLCTRVLDGERERPLTDADRRAFRAEQERMARGGLRTLAAARRSLPAGHALEAEAVERELVLLGLFGLLDPPRPEVPEAVLRARRAGVRVLMITGDAPATAEAIADGVGLPPRRVLTGPELERLDDAALRDALSEDLLFARTTAAHKLRIVTQLQQRGEIVGMTGDGVNDAPALRKADIGIAMGVRGTDVARGAADIVLTDDNFASIVDAIEEGRRQHDNIRRFIGYLASSNVGEIVAILAVLAPGGPLILLPAQILWMNLVTDGLTAVALGLEPAERDVMRRPPRRPGSPFLGPRDLGAVLGMGAAIGAVAAGLYLWASRAGAGDSGHARTLAFTGIIVAELLNVLNFRARSAPPTRGWTRGHHWLHAAIVASLALQITAVHAPFARSLLHTVPLDLADWLVVLLAAAPIVALPAAWRRRRPADAPGT